MIKRLCLLVLFLTASLMSPAQALACSCTVPPPPLAALKESRAVFSGRVLEIEHVNPLDDSSNPIEVLFSVNEAWKGVERDRITVSTERMEASCGFEFKEGEEYLVYANVLKKRLHTGLCSRTKAISLAGKDVAALGPGTVPARAPATTASDMPQSKTTAPVIAVIVIAVAGAVGAALFVLVRRGRQAK